MSDATIDILLATFNGEPYVSEQIASIQAQSYSNWRLLVSDDGSSDNTIETVREFERADSRIRFVSNGDRFGSAKANFMFLLSQSTSPYAMFCDQDDVWLPNKLERTIALMDQLECQYGKDLPLVAYCDMKVVDANLNVIHESFEKCERLYPKATQFEHLVVENTAAGCTMLINDPLRRLMLEASDTKDILMHDSWAMMIASAFGHIGYCDQPLSLYRQHEHNEVGADQYSVLNPVTPIDYRVDCRRLCFGQAKYFLTLFGDRLSERKREHVQSLIYTGDATNYLLACYHMFRSRCWRKGIRRKLADLDTTRVVVQRNRERKTVTR